MTRSLALLLALSITPFAFAQPTTDTTEQRHREIAEAGKAGGEAAATVLGIGIVTFVILVILSLALNLLPVVIAAMRGHPNTLAIAAVSFLLGWTCIGWIAALIWSLTAVPNRHYHDDDEDDRPRRRR